MNSLIGPDLGVLLITHYQRLLDYIKPDYVHVFYNGKIVMSGGPELALDLEARGYQWIREQFGPAIFGERRNQRNACPVATPVRVKRQICG